MKRVICKTKEELDEQLTLLNKQLFSWDTETSTTREDENKYEKAALRQDCLFITGISFCDGNNAFYAPINSVRNENNQPAIALKDFIELMNKHFLNFKGVKNIAHNWVFDARVMYKHGIDMSESKNFDTMLAHYYINENEQHGLKYLTKTLLHKEVVEFNEVGQNHYTEEFYNYGIDDAVNTWELYKLLRPQLKKEGVEWAFFNIEIPFQKAILEMNIKGFNINKNKVKEHSEKLKLLLTDKLIDLLDFLKEPYMLQTNLLGDDLEVVSKLNLNSPKQVIKLFERFNLEIIETTPTGGPSVGVKTLKTHKENPFVNKLIKYRKISKLYNAFYKPMPEYIQKDGRIRSNINQARAATYRLSVSKPNLQQLSNVEDDEEIPNLRECYIASPGKKLVITDFRQQETRVMAQLSKDPTLIKIINDGGDVHMFSANLAFNLGIPEEYLYESHPKFEETKNKYKKERKKAKVFSFAIPYGAGAHNIAANFNISQDKAQEMLDNYFAGFTKLKKVIDDTHALVKKQGWVRCYGGVKRRLPVSDDDFALTAKSMRQSFNFLIQASSALMTKIACNKIYNYARKHPEMGINLLIPVHDELIVECDEAHATKLREVCLKAFSSSVTDKFVVPMPASSDIVDNYSEAK